MKNDILIYFDIITSIKTVVRMNSLLSEIDHVLESLFITAPKSLENTFKEISFDTATKLKEILKKKGLNLEDKENIKDLLAVLKELLKKFKVIKLTLAIDPSYKTIENISKWVSLNLGEGYLLSTETDETLIGGAVVVFNGRYNDLTLKKNLRTVFNTKRNEILPSNNT